MERRDLLKGAFAAGLLSAPQLRAQTAPTTEVVIERAVSGRPHGQGAGPDHTPFG